MKQRKILTTVSGSPVPNNQHSLSAGPRGPLLMQDHYLIEKMAHFNRERIPERVVHAKGYGAYGVFTVTRDISLYTKAKMFAAIGKQTECFCRFSALLGESGSGDNSRDIRGFALKFYTEEGNWDLVGNNTPVFFIRDPIKFPDLMHALKREPGSHLKSKWTKWDFWSLCPESLHQILMLYSDRGIPVSARFMNGYGSHTYCLVNDINKRYWVKFHFQSQQGIRNFSDEEARRIAGEDPDYSARDLHGAIRKRRFPRWKLFVQLMPEDHALIYRYHPFDVTKVWLHDDYPLIEVGVLELNNNPRNYFAEVEQAAFSPSNIVPGIGFSPDKMLQNRILAYPDAHHYRLGINHDQIPVNQAKNCEVHSYSRDGLMRVDGNYGDEVNYEPNSFGGPEQADQFLEPSLKIDSIADRFLAYHCDYTDYYEQPMLFYRKVLSDVERTRLIQNIVADMRDIPEPIQRRQLGHFVKVDVGFGEKIGEGLGLKNNRGADDPTQPSGILRVGNSRS
ncbi:MAG: catalase [Gammaproteobacteria bacterium]